MMAPREVFLTKYAGFVTAIVAALASFLFAWGITRSEVTHNTKAIEKNQVSVEKCTKTGSENTAGINLLNGKLDLVLDMVRDMRDEIKRQRRHR